MVPFLYIIQPFDLYRNIVLFTHYEDVYFNVLKACSREGGEDPEDRQQKAARWPQGITAQCHHHAWSGAPGKPPFLYRFKYFSPLHWKLSHSQFIYA